MTTDENNEVEICIECGVSVKWKSGNFVNRVLVADDYNEKIEQRRPYPEGKYICSTCDEETL